MVELLKPERRTGNPRILIVDGDESVRRVVARLLGPLCDTIIQASSAEQALEMVREAPPDLVVLDVDLPGQTGHEVLEAIRANADLRLVPVVMISGEASREDRLRAIRAGVTDFIAKPFDAEELVVRIGWLVHLKAFTDTLEEPHRVLVTLAHTVDARDAYTAGHSERVSMYAGVLAQQVGLEEQEVATIRQGSLLHDLGKIAVSDRVLFKPGKLTSEEFAEIQRHPVVGYEILEPMKTLVEALTIVRSHHERLDGSGYPDGLLGAEIPRRVRIATVADVYDGLTSLRPYRQAYSSAKALEIMRDEARKRWLDAGLVDEFRKTLEVLARPCLSPTAT